MSTKKKSPHKKPHKQATDKVEVFVLSDEALQNLAGFFDVLVQIDLEQKSKERSKNESIRDTDTSNKAI